MRFIWIILDYFSDFLFDFLAKMVFLATLGFLAKLDILAKLGFLAKLSFLANFPRLRRDPIFFVMFGNFEQKWPKICVMPTLHISAQLVVVF